MYSCDNLLLSKIMSNSSYEELALANGITNNIRTVNYGDAEIDFPDGRGYLDYTYVLDKHNMQYEIISISELIQLKEYSKVIVLVPKEYLDYEDKLNIHVTQLAIIYSAFEIKWIKGNKIMLNLVENRWFDYSKELSIDYLKMLEKILAKPLGFLLKVILLKRKTRKFTREEIKVKIRENVNNCIYNTETMKENTKCIAGVQFYSLLGKKIIELSKLDTETSKNRVKIFTFSSTLNAGSSAFYRRDFANALIGGEYILSKDKLYIRDCFDKAIRAWEELQRIVRFLQNGDKQYIGDEKIYNLLRDIEKNEMAIFIFLREEV